MKKACLILLLALPGLLVSLPGEAAPRLQGGLSMPIGSAPQGPVAETLARDTVSLDQAVALVRRQTNGRIIKASTRRSNGRSVHHVRVLTRDGRVFTVRIDAASGRRL